MRNSRLYLAFIAFGGTVLTTSPSWAIGATIDPMGFAVWLRALFGAG